MVTLFTLCKTCANKPNCRQSEDFRNTVCVIEEIDQYTTHELREMTGIKISCNKYETNYGKGLGT